MNWREKTVIRILLLVARFVSDDPAMQKEIETLSTHVSVWSPRAGE